MSLFESKIVLVISILLGLGPFLLYRFRTEYPVPEEGSGILITGVSSGIGRDAMLELAHRGYVVYGTVRNEQDANKIREQGKKQTGEIVPIVMDVRKSEQIHRAKEFITSDLAKRNIKLAGVVNNAGVAHSSLVEQVDMDKARQLFDVNFFGVLEVTKEFLPLLRRDQGRMVVVGSVAGSLSTETLSVYSASKFAIEGFADGLRRELDAFLVSVSVIQPGLVQSKITQPSAGEQTFEQKLKTIHDDYSLLKERLQKRSARTSSLEIVKPFQSTTPAIVHALENRHPQTRYACAGYGSSYPAWMLVALGKYVPDRIQDLILIYG
mmetsp:Transcript_13299/g.21730  ORF Transcript_13299/g.21730 Transcript_13299/m.21730 type:complete len:323 (+) Transcript_13299:90-1058(+)|eukprot:CAMPEP_0203758162 /NCGR_PEP_ID=MMETSP0098-20131031/10912_1 /ASSEMBLY_ACC=CAM_ASM_000208 /TAXON_ID=96639 /ORGANISM=" , Strain NY0313808BC1" /LENGTH=322 /DNA_ID=CAMNT_0050650443 /DNA_START=90 /DNA_END=1058 /DNA_ORIENTATION=+